MYNELKTVPSRDSIYDMHHCINYYWQLNIKEHWVKKMKNISLASGLITLFTDVGTRYTGQKDI